MMGAPHHRNSNAGTTASRAYRREPRLPHERDQSSDGNAPPNENALVVGQQAARDLDRGLVDTSVGPVFDKLSAEHFKPARRRARKRG